MAQGATQFCRKDVFAALNGCDETLFMGEDVDYYRRDRRFDQWGLWRTLIWTNPLFILVFRRRKAAWHGWYKEVPR